MATKNDNCLGVHTNRTRGIWVTCTNERPCVPCQGERVVLFDSPDFYGEPFDYPEDEDDQPPGREW